MSNFLNYKYNRDEIEEAIAFLAQKYPKCFFANPRMRRPLKKNIITDLLADGASDLQTEGADFYQTHYGYHLCQQTGAKRIGLDGEEAGTVTEPEALVAQRKAGEARETMKKVQGEKRAAALTLPSVKYGEFPKFLKKINPPQPAMSSKPMITTAAPVIIPMLTRAYDAFLAANAAISAVQNPTMVAPVTAAMLDIVAKELQAVIAGNTAVE